jgi:hypothetical protein
VRNRTRRTQEKHTGGHRKTKKEVYPRLEPKTRPEENLKGSREQSREPAESAEESTVAEEY